MSPVSSPSSRLASIGSKLSDLGAQVGNLVRQVQGLPPVSTPESPPSRYTGSARRLTPEERAKAISMLKRDDLYTAQDIASELRISRAAVYLIARSEGLTQHTRGPAAHA